MTTIREERPEDFEEVRHIHRLAFGQDAEGRLVDLLRGCGGAVVSIVAVDGATGAVIGHILFSPARIEGDRIVEGMGLAPMAVLPKFQRQGIGTRMVQAGIEMLKNQGWPFIIVLGHPEYYPRFGFERASHKGVSCQWEGVPDEAFMILILDEKAMERVSGVVKYRCEFDEAM